MSEPNADTPATEQPTDFAAFEARHNAIAAGETPPAEPEPTPAPVADPDEEPESEPAPAPVSAAAPTPEKPVSKRQQQINDLIRARAESDRRAEDLAAKLAAIEARTAPKEPAKEPEAAPVVDPTDPEPQEASFDDYRAFVKAQAKWEIRQARREADAEAETRQRATSEATRRADLAQRESTWSERRDAFAATTPDFATKAIPFLDHVFSGTPIGDVIVESEVGPQIALYLATHPDEADRIARLAPISALRALGKLEAKFDTPTSASASAGPAAKTVTSAPAAPTTLSARSAAPADPAADALATGDFERWEAEENRKALQAAR